MPHTNVLDRLRVAVRELPRGHYGIKEAKKAVEDEYALCKEIEAHWAKTNLRKKHKAFRTLTKRQVADFIKFAVDLLGLRKSPKVVFEHEKLNACYEYCTKTIFLFPTPHFTVVVHELAHFVCHMERLSQHAHRGDFLWVEQMLFDVANEWLEK